MYTTQTKNKSFIKMWRQLQKMEVDNAEEILYLKNENLCDTDVFNILLENDTSIPNIREMIIKECKENIWFFFREVVKLPIIATSDECTRFIITKESYILIKNYIKGIPTMLVKDTFTPHSGITTTLLLLALYHNLIIKEKSFISEYRLMPSDDIRPYIRRLLSDNMDSLLVTSTDDYCPKVILKDIYHDGGDDNNLNVFIVKNDFMKFLTNLLINIDNNTSTKYIGYIRKFETPRVHRDSNELEKTLKAIYDKILSKNIVELHMNIPDHFKRLLEMDNKSGIVVLND